MREIKFSLIYQHEETGMIVEKICSLSQLIDYGYPQDMDRYNLVIIRQYTGLKDKNGIDIFEGDIIEYPSFEDYYTEEDGTQEKIIYKNYELYQDKYGAYKLKGWDNGMTWDDYSDQPILSIGKVIGNIYEHPNLLTNQL